jgi:hypothetical protein
VVRPSLLLGCWAVGLLGGAWVDSVPISQLPFDGTCLPASGAAPCGVPLRDLLSAGRPRPGIPRPAGLRTSQPLRPRMIKPPSQAPFAPLPSGLLPISYIPSSAPRGASCATAHPPFYIATCLTVTYSALGTLHSLDFPATN